MNKTTPEPTDPAGVSGMADDLSLRDRLMIEIAYCRHAKIPVSEEATRLLAIMSTRTPPVLEVAKEALTDEQVQRALDAFNGGLVRLPDSTNERGYVDWYRPKDAMRAALQKEK